MNENKNKTEISLLGQRFSVRSEHSPEYIQQLAQTVATQAEKIRKSTNSLSTHQLAILTCINLADQLQQNQTELNVLRQAAKTQIEQTILEVDQLIAKLNEREKSPNPIY